MLTDLIIKNFAIIENLHVSFSTGFNVLTGETGAGKSIILDAVGLLLGGGPEGMSSVPVLKKHRSKRFLPCPRLIRLLPGWPP